MIGFLVIAAAAALVTGLIVVRPMLRNWKGAREDNGEDASAGTDAGLDVEFHREQLAEIDRDLERGAISAAEAEGAKEEISRRLLAVARKIERKVDSRGKKAPSADAPPRRHSTWATAVVALLIPVVAVSIYAGPNGLGSPDMPDRSFVARDFASEWAQIVGRESGNPSRLNQVHAEAFFPTPLDAPDVNGNTDESVEAEYARLVAQLEERLAETPNDARGLRLLAESHMRLGRHGKAWRIFEQLIGVLGAENGMDNVDADLFARAGEGMILAAGGYVSPEAERMIGAALERDRTNPVARYYAGLSLNQNGLVPQAVRVWRDLRAESSADAPWLPLLDETLAHAWIRMGDSVEDLQRRETADLPGPTAEDVEAAAQLSAEDRREMILSMVSQLEARLTSNGGSADEWVRLMTSYVRLGNMESAKRIFDLGQSALKGQEAGYLRERALALGVAVQ